MTQKNKFIKRIFDLSVSFVGIGLFGVIILLSIVIATLNTGRNGLFSQRRVGKNGRLFRLYKIRTMKSIESFQTDVTTDNDPRITKLGRFFRKSKIDELPQLVNVLLGHMSLVGPRPDVPSYADTLNEEDRIILTIRPGITGPATLKYKDEEALLAKHKNPEAYYREVIWPDKVNINKGYILNWSFRMDLLYILKTIWG
jgi:lipopolysaccharide/colanic/teichoic acid biosynthesis glycosyltransferase